MILRACAIAALFVASGLGGGCTPLVLASVAQSLIGGAAERSAGMASPVGGPAPAVQNGRLPDESVMQALAASEATVSAACRQALPELPPVAEGRCETRPVCLPGARMPIQARLCAMVSEQTMQARDSLAAAPPASAGWDWEAVQ